MSERRTLKENSLSWALNKATWQCRSRGLFRVFDENPNHALYSLVVVVNNIVWLKFKTNVCDFSGSGAAVLQLEVRDSDPAMRSNFKSDHRKWRRKLTNCDRDQMFPTMEFVSSRKMNVRRRNSSAGLATPP